MLSDNILEELTRPTKLQQQLATMAWPDLAVESKLQLLDSQHMMMPTWLLELAWADAAAVVRFWAIRFAYLPKPQRDGTNACFKESRERVLQDHEPLVRACCTNRDEGYFNYQFLTRMSALERLLSIRNLIRPRFSLFVDWLAVVVGTVDDDQLSDAAIEFFSLPKIRLELSGNASDDIEYIRSYSDETLLKAWHITKQSGQLLTFQLAKCLPLNGGSSGKIGAVQLAELPIYLLRRLIDRSFEDKHAVLIELMELIRSQPNRFHKEVCSSLSKLDDLEASPRVAS